jgi:hypothetical protein
MIRLFDHVVIVKLSAFPGKSFTSCPGIGSGIFSENQDLVEHLSPPLIFLDIDGLKYYFDFENDGVQRHSLRRINLKSSFFNSGLYGFGVL